MDRSWIHEKVGARYHKGVDDFLEFAFSKSSVEGKIRCPCKRCLNCFWKTRYEVRTDLICIGFDPNYDQWDAHGEVYRPKFVDAPIVEDNDSDGECEDSDDDGDDIHGLLHDAFGPLGSDNCVDNETDSAILGEEPNEDAQKFYKLLKESETDLYPDCTGFLRLSFTAKLAKRDEELAKREDELAKQAEEAAAKAAQMQAMIDRAVAQAMRQAMGIYAMSTSDR